MPAAPFLPRLPARPVLLVLLAALLLPGAALATDTLRRIRDAGVIVMGYRANSAPFSYLDARLRPIGYSIDLCEHVIEAVRRRLDLPDLETKRIAVSSATRLPLVANGTLDLECGVTTHTAERAKTQSFSLTTFIAESKLLSRRAEPVQGLDDLRGQPVVSTLGTTSILFLDAVNQRRRLEMRILLGQDDQEAFRMLQSGRALAYAMDDVLLRSLVAQSGRPDEFVIAAVPLTVEPYAIGLPAADPEFKQLVDGVLAGLFRSGEIQAIYRRWFQTALPGSGINLQLPMSEALKRAIAKPTDSPDPEHYR